MKEIVYLLIALAFTIVIGGSMMRGAEQLDKSTGDGTIDQETLSESFLATPTPIVETTPAPRSFPDDGTLD